MTKNVTWRAQESNLWWPRRYFGLFKGLKSSIIITLTVVVGLGMVMTVVVIAVFWQRDVLQREVNSISRQLSLLSSIYSHGVSDSSSALSVKTKEKLAAIMHTTGALAGLFSMHEILIRIPDTRQGKQLVNLRRVVQQARATGKTKKRLFGPGWGLLLPTNKLLAVAVPIAQHDKVVGAVGVLIPLAPVYASLSGAYRIIFVYLLVNLLVLVVVGLFRFMAIMVRPVEKLVRMTDAYQEEDGIPFLSFQAGGQFEQLSHSLNKMLGRIETDRKKLQATVQSLQQANRELVDTRREVVRAEKLASVGRLAAGLAHEIGNPIGVVLGYLGLLRQQGLDPAERRDFADRCENELQRINNLVRQLLDFSRVNSGNKERFSLHVLLDDIIAMMESQPLMRAMQIRTDFSASRDTILADPDQIRQVFVNCFLNSADAMADCGDIEQTLVISTRELAAESDGGTSDKGESDRIEIRVTDTGTGIAKENIDSVFDPFFTTKEPGKGTGLGLSVAYSIVEDCGGTMKVQSRAGKGTTLILTLPLV